MMLSPIGFHLTHVPSTESDVAFGVAFEALKVVDSVVMTRPSGDFVLRISLNCDTGHDSASVSVNTN